MVPGLTDSRSASDPIDQTVCPAALRLADDASSGSAQAWLLWPMVSSVYVVGVEGYTDNSAVGLGRRPGGRPLLQGLRKPVNDLSRGATLRDIVNTVAIAVIQAQRSRNPS